MRRLSGAFMDDLAQGVLSPLRDRVLADRSLCLEIRDDYLNIYYRGGNLLRKPNNSSSATTTSAASVERRTTTSATSSTPYPSGASTS